MPVKEKFQEIIDKVKKTFAILRDVFMETPLEPPSGKARPSQEMPESPKPEPARTGEVEARKVTARKPRPARALPKTETAPQPEAEQRYLESLLAAYENVELPGLKPLTVPLEKVYWPLAFMDKRLGAIRPERDDGLYGGAAPLSMAGAMLRYRRLIITGGAGSGKTSLLITTLLAYLRGLTGQEVPAAPAAGFSPVSRKRLQVGDKEHLPMLLSLRTLGEYLKTNFRRSSKDGPERLLNCLRESITGFGTEPANDIFEAHLKSGKAVVLLDGLDEVADGRLRLRVRRLVERFVQHYPDCRYIVTSRPQGELGQVLLGEQFGTLEIRDLTASESRQFARAWSTTLETALAGAETAAAQEFARERAEKLIKQFESSPRLARAAASPQGLILLAFVQRNRERWPGNRVELVDAAIDVQLGAWLSGADGSQGLDRMECRRTLEMIAFRLQALNQFEVKRDELVSWVQEWFAARQNGEAGLADARAQVFLQLVDKGGLFGANRNGRPGFGQRMIQEHLAAQALADREDSLAYTLQCLDAPWWREVIVSEAGLLSSLAGHRVSELIHFILDGAAKTDMNPVQVSLLAAECLADLDPKRIEAGLLEDVRKRLKKLVNSALKDGDAEGVLSKAAASNALVSLKGGQPLARFWKPPFGEPEWVSIPAGEFWMGAAAGDAAEGLYPGHTVSLGSFQISRAPVTNAQYAIYLNESGAEAPDDWRDGQPPRGKDNHPVVNVNWHEALAYSTWMSGKINQAVCLPSEAEWERAARGDQDQRNYPWGDWEAARANTSELGIGDTTAVGVFPKGASPAGVLDMCGNVREWTRSLADFGYPYDPADKAREDLQALDDQPRVLRGGSFHYTREFARCFDRQRYYPDFRFFNFGFRVVVLGT